MLSQKKFSTFSQQVEWFRDKKHLIISEEQYDKNELLHRMGFPSNWKNITRYRLTK